MSLPTNFFIARGAVSLRDPLVFLYPSEWFSYHGVDPYFVAGDTIFFHSSASNFSFSSAQTQNISYIEYLVVGGGGSTPSDNAGWCSPSGGGGGGGAYGHLTNNQMTDSYNIAIGTGAGGSTSATQNQSSGSASSLALASNTNFYAQGRGGRNGSWCENAANTISGGYGSGGGWTAVLGSNTAGSNGGQGGMPHFDDGVELATAGSSSAYGGGGGGGASDSHTQTSTQAGGTGMTSVPWVSGSGGIGDGYANYANKTPTANRGGGAGGLASTASIALSQSPNGADGFVAFHMVG